MGYTSKLRTVGESQMVTPVGELPKTFIETITDNIWLVGSCLQSLATSFFNGLYYIVFCGCCSDYSHVDGPDLSGVFQNAHGPSGQTNASFLATTVIEENEEEKIARMEQAERFWNEQCENISAIGLANEYISLDHLRSGPAGTCEGLNMTLLPMIGHYDPMGYRFAYQLLTVRLPASQISRFPQEIQDRFRGLGPEQIDLFFTVFDGSHLPTNSRNIINHHFARPGVRHGEFARDSLNMGIFAHRGLNGEVPAVGALSSNSFGVMDTFIHPAASGDMALSPNNAKFNVDPEQDMMSSLYHACTLPEGRGVAFMGLIINQESAVENMTSVLACSGNIPAFVENVMPILDVEEQGRVRQILTFARD